MRVFRKGEDMKLKRRKDKEFDWVRSFKHIFTLPMYRFVCEDGKEYAVVARYWGDADYWYSFRLRVKKNHKGRDDSHPMFKKYNGKGELYRKPFWCYGRVYEIISE